MKLPTLKTKLDPQKHIAESGLWSCKNPVESACGAAQHLIFVAINNSKKAPLIKCWAFTPSQVSFFNWFVPYSGACSLLRRRLRKNIG